MKRIFVILLLLLPLISFSQKWVKIGDKAISNIVAFTPIDTVYIIIQAGQSNAVGQTAAAGSGIGTLPLTYQGLWSNAYIYYEGDYLSNDTSRGRFVEMYPNYNTVNYTYSNPNVPASYNFGGFSTELKCSYDLSSYYNRKIFIIKNAYGANDLDFWESPTGAGWIELKRQIQHATTWAILKGAYPKFLSMSWLQGESDIINGKTATYTDRLRTFISNVRAINQYTDSIQFCMFKLSLSGNTVPGIAAINSSFATIDAESDLNIEIETTGQPQFNTLHYSATALINLGTIWADSIKVKYP